MCTWCNLINGMNSPTNKEFLRSTHTKDASKKWKKLWVKALKAHHSSNLQVQKCHLLLCSLNDGLSLRSNIRNLCMFDGKVTLMCFDNVKNLHYNLSCCFSLFLAFFDNHSILQYPSIIPKVPWRALFLVILHHHLSSSFIIPHHHHHPLSYLTIIIILCHISPSSCCCPTSFNISPLCHVIPEPNQNVVKPKFCNSKLKITMDVLFGI